MTAELSTIHSQPSTPAPVIFTHCGKLGDMLYALPVAEWFYRTHGRKVHWVLPHGFGPFHYIRELLVLQEHCHDVTLVHHKLANLDAGGQPYRFNPADHGIEGEYFNLGFRDYPDRFIPAFYASEHGFGFVPGYRLRLWSSPEAGAQALQLQLMSEEILRSGETAMAKFAPHATPLPPVMDLLGLARAVSMAKEFHTWFCGLAVLAYMARVPQHIYRVPGHAPKHLYFPDDQDITWHEVSL